MFLLVVEDRHAERELRRVLTSARAAGDQTRVLTGDALLAMRLRRDGVDARLTIHRMSTDAGAGRDTSLMADLDRIALDGVAAAFGRHASSGGRDFGPYLQYTLIPIFIRAVRNVAAADEAIGDAARVMLIGGGPLIDAMRLVAAHRGIAVESSAGDPFTRLSEGIARLEAGRATRWVNTTFRALVLEPGFIWLLFLGGLWRRIIGRSLPAPRRGALIVVGDRFTADVIEQLRGTARPIVLAGATQPGRALFDTAAAGSELTPIEGFTRFGDVLRWIGATIDAVAQAFRLASDEAHARQFTVRGVPYWPLVGRAVWLHLIMWLPTLQHLQALAARAAGACPESQLLTSSDVTAYNRVLIDTTRAFGVTSTGIQHGITGEPNGHSVVHVNVLASWGSTTEPWYRAHEPRQTTRFAITGNPRFDALAVRPVAINHQPSAIFTVCVCTGFMSDFSIGASEYENLLMLDSVLAWAKTRDEVRVIHKMHPGEELEYYAGAARALGWDAQKLTTIREPILYDVLEQSGVLVAAYSTTVLESIALGTPAIVFDAIVQRRLLALDRVPGILIACTIDELHAGLDAGRAGPAPDRQVLRTSAELKDYISELDGHATERVAALLDLT